MNHETRTAIEHMKAVAEGAHELGVDAAEQPVGSLASTGAQARALVAKIQKKIGVVRTAAAGKVCTTARETDAYVREAPWRFIGTAAVVGLAIGLLLKRR